MDTTRVWKVREAEIAPVQARGLPLKLVVAVVSPHAHCGPHPHPPTPRREGPRAGGGGGRGREVVTGGWVTCRRTQGLEKVGRWWLEEGGTHGRECSVDQNGGQEVWCFSLRWKEGRTCLQGVPRPVRPQSSSRVPSSHREWGR